MDHLLWDFKAVQSRLAKRLGMKLIMLPTEGLHRDPEEALVRAGSRWGVAGTVDCHISWGPYVRDRYLDARIADASRICVTGCPRFDFYSSRFREFTSPRQTFLRQLKITGPERPVVLWATNTTYVARDQQSVIRRHSRRGKLAESEIRAWLADENIQFREHSHTVVELAKMHPDWIFVIKVHPAEWVNPYFDIVRQAPNLHLGFNAPFREFLHNCDILLQRGCTTATEAWMLGKPVLELEIGTYNIPTQPLYDRANHVVRSTAEADAALRMYLNSGAPVPADAQRIRENFIREFCWRVDGYSAERCAEAIHKTVQPPAYTEDHQSDMRRATCLEHETWKALEDARWPNRIKGVLGIPRERPLRFWRTLLRREQRDNLGLFVAEPEIEPDAVQALHARFSALGLLESGDHARVAVSG